MKSLPLALVLGVPLYLDLLVLSWKKDLAGLDWTRAKFAFWGMVAATLAALPVPLLLWDMPDSQRHAPMPNLSAWAYLGGIGVTVVACPFIAFGRGRFRWVGLSSSAVSLALLLLFTLLNGLGSAQM